MGQKEKGTRGMRSSVVKRKARPRAGNDQCRIER